MKVVAKWLEYIPPDQRKDTVNTVKYYFKYSERQATPLQIAARFNQPEIAKILLEAGAGMHAYIKVLQVCV